jgi:hypothetical protein
MSERKPPFIVNLLAVTLVVGIYGRKALVVVRPVALPLIWVACWFAYGCAALLGLLQVLLNVWDAAMLVAIGREASVYCSMLAEHGTLSGHGLITALLYWAMLAYAALFFCFGRILQFTAGGYRALSDRVSFSLL